MIYPQPNITLTDWHSIERLNRGKLQTYLYSGIPGETAMKTRLLCLLLSIVALTGLPVIANADGYIIMPVIGKDWTWVDENSQQAFINYQDGLEKLIVAVDMEKHDSDAVWIMPVPGKPEDVRIDIISDLPRLSGYDVDEKARATLAKNMKNSSAVAALGQLWISIPALAMLIVYESIFFAMGPGSVNAPAVANDMVSVEAHIEKKGMVAEVITARAARALYEYLSAKGLRIEPDSIPALDSYAGRDYVFVALWLSGIPQSQDASQRRGIFITFPTSRLYYPLVPTSAYEHGNIPISIRVLGHVKPRIYQKIDRYTSIRYLRGANTDKPSAELQAFYGNRVEWKGRVDYTRISIDAPVRQLKEDLWMKARSPLWILFARSVAENSLASGIAIYVLSAVAFSFCAGGLAGLLQFRKFRKYAFVGLANVLSMLGLVFVLAFTREKHSIRARIGFVFYFSIIFLCFVGLFWLSSRVLVSDIQYVKVSKTSEATANLGAIRTCQESYFDYKGVYVECSPSPPGGGDDSVPDPWVDAGGFGEIGFETDGPVRYRYEVRVSDDGKSFVAIAVGDSDGDGFTFAYVVDKSSPTYPKAVKDRDGLYSDGDDF